MIGGGSVAISTGSTTAACMGLTAKQAFATGTLTYNLVAAFIAPLFGVNMEPLEYETSSESFYTPQPNSPPHPAER